MTHTTTTQNEQPATVPDDPAALRADIEEARSRLSDTVDELRYRLDVKTRAKESAERARSRVTDAGRSAADAVNRNRKPVMLAGGGLVLAAAVMGGSILAWRRRSR